MAKLRQNYGKTAEKLLPAPFPKAMLNYNFDAFVKPSVSNRLDGRSDATALAQFQQDDAICKGEVAKAQAIAAPIYMGRSLADAMEAGMLEGQRNSALRQIMVGCMAQRGYTMTVVTVPQ